MVAGHNHVISEHVFEESLDSDFNDRYESPAKTERVVKFKDLD